MIVFRVLQIFFDFIAMACFASVASFQAKWKVGPCTSHSDPTLFPLLIIRITSGFVWLCRLCLSDKHLPLFVRVARTCGIREIR